MLQDNKVPADLITDLKNSDKAVFTTDKEFIADLETQFGADRLKPYHDSLITAGLNIQASWCCLPSSASWLPLPFHWGR